MIYFDHNATTPVDERVIEVMLPYLTTFYANPSSLYRMGRMVRSAIDTAREQVAILVDTQPSQVIFTSGGTEANNLALNHTHFKIAVSAIEHPSVTEIAKKSNAIEIAVNTDGVVNLSEIESLFQSNDSPDLISIMMANNETGALQNIEAIADYLINQSCLLHTDAVQAVGKIPVSFNQLNVNLMSISSHKIYGPKGCGALIVDKNTAVEALMIGGGQENNIRSGTENVAAIIGFGKAAELALLEQQQHSANILLLKNDLEQQINQIKGSIIFSKAVNRLPNTILVGFEGFDAEMLLMQLDQKNIAISTGSACSSVESKASSVLTAMGVNKKLAKSAIRISLGKANSQADVTQFITILKSFLIKME